MLQQHLQIFFRKLIRRDTVTYINIIGLSVGLACSILILIWIKNELTYDNFHSNYKDIYRIELTTLSEGVIDDVGPITMPPIGPALVDNFEEIKSFVRLQKIEELIFENEGEFYNEENFLAVDSSFFSIFSFRLIQGNPTRALSDPYKIVLSESSAKKIFGNENALGKSILVNGQDHYIVSGIVADPPPNSHIKFNGLISISTLWQDDPCMKWDCNYSFYTYLLLNEDSNKKELEAAFPGFLWEPMNKKNEADGWKEEAKLMPLSEIHFGSTTNYEMSPPGNSGMLFLLSAIAIFILSLACINFINLSTAQSTKKGKEIGIKKVAGASRIQLAIQMLLEVFIQSGISMALAIISVELILPSFNNILNQQLEIDYNSKVILVSITALVALVTLGAGFYPALYLTKFQPIKVLKSETNLRSQHSGLRNSLIVIQFTFSTALIAGTIIIYNQLQFIHNFDLGFDKENIITVPLSSEEARKQYKNLKNEFKQLSEVVSVGASTFIPGGGMTSNGYLPEGFESPILFHVLDVDADFLETLGVEVVLGRNFSKEFSTDKSAFIINEQLARQLDWKEPINKVINRNGSHKVIGLIKDFNFLSLHQQMEPLIITHNPWEGMGDFGYLSIRVQTDNYSETIASLEHIWKNRVPDLPFEFNFLENKLNMQYDSEKRLGEVFIYFSVLAIFISCLGLFGLVVFLTDQKTKEIGIRKALGGSASDILQLLSADLSKWILIAFLLAIPLAWIILNKWLMNFAYATDINWWTFGLAGCITLAITWLTISWHTIKAARKNPVDALRYE